MNLNTLKHITCLVTIALVALCVPASLCQASVEPELTTAIRQKNVPRVQQLLASGANVNARDEGDEDTPLIWAVQVKDVALVQILLAHGAAINAQDDSGKTALMFAAERDNVEIIKLLLRKGADVSLRDAASATAADIAHAHGRTLPSYFPRVASRKSTKSTIDHAVRVAALR